MFCLAQLISLNPIKQVPSLIFLCQNPLQTIIFQLKSLSEIFPTLLIPDNFRVVVWVWSMKKHCLFSAPLLSTPGNH